MHENVTIAATARRAAASAARGPGAGAAPAKFEWSLEMAPREAPALKSASALLAAHTRVYVPWTPRRTPVELLAAVRAIHAGGLEPVLHVSARHLSDGNACEALLARMVGDHGLRRVLLVAGDATTCGPYKDSTSLLRSGVLVRAGVREVGFAAYPEGHPHVQSALRKLLRDKLAAARAQGLAPYFVTQFSFAPHRILACCGELARIAPDVPVHIGMAAPAAPQALLRYARRCRVDVSRGALRQLGSGMAGLAMHTDPAEQLTLIKRHVSGRAQSNVAGVHLFGFGGGLEAAAHWVRQCGGMSAPLS